jgi:hypothetical protein
MNTSCSAELNMFKLDAMILGSKIRYRQILNLRTLVLKFCIFGNDVKYQEFKATERSEGVLKFGTSRYWLLTLALDERIYVMGHISAILISAGIENGRTLVENLAGFNVGALVEFSEAISQRPEVFPRLRSLA